MRGCYYEHSKYSRARTSSYFGYIHNLAIFGCTMNELHRFSGPFTDLDTRYLGIHRGREQHLLLQQFVYFPDAGPPITVPEGFIFDWDSVPRLPLVYMFLKNRTKAAAAIHDYLYEVKPVTRRKADILFLRAMRDEGVKWYYRFPIYAGVRIGGWLGWNRPGTHPNLPEK
jgi:hypothetical protein